jgi:hypothetical protein
MFDGLVITIWFNRNVDILTNFICFSTDVWWLGYNDMVQEGVLKTYNDLTAPWSNMISRWGNFDKDCIVISPAHDFQWIERTCDDSYNAVCEIPLGKIA